MISAVYSLKQQEKSSKVNMSSCEDEETVMQLQNDDANKQKPKFGLTDRLVVSFLPIFRCVEGWLCQKEVVFLWFTTQVLENALVPQALHVVPVFNKPMANGIS